LKRETTKRIPSCESAVGDSKLLNDWFKSRPEELLARSDEGESIIPTGHQYELMFKN
jgi:hypothetical protein